MTKKEIIDTILKVKELTLGKFAMECGILPTTLTMSLNRNKLSDEIVNKIIYKYGISRQYLKNGKGEMFEENEKEKSPSKNLADEFVTKQVLDIIVQSNDKERESLKSLNEKYEVIIQLLRDEVKEYKQEIIHLKNDKKELEKELLRKFSTG